MKPNPTRAFPLVILSKIDIKPEKGTKTYASLSLGVALARNDLFQTNKILRDHRKDLGAGDQIAALVRLRRDHEALDLALSSWLKKPGARNAQLYLRQANNILVRVPRLASGYVDYDQQGGLEVRRLGARYLFSTTGYQFSLVAGQNTLSSLEQGQFQFETNDEVQTQVGLIVPSKRATLRLTAGFNHRFGADTVFSGQLAYRHRLLPFLEGTTDIHLNTVANDGSLVRLSGVKDEVRAGFNSDFFPRIFVSATTSLIAYRTRDRRDTLASGFGFDGQAGYQILRDRLKWRLRTTASARALQTTSTTPSALGNLLPGTTDPSTLLPISGGSLGIGTTLEKGEVGSVPLFHSALRYSFDLWAGYLWPAQVVGYQVAGQAGIPLFGADEIGLRGQVANATGNTGGFTQLQRTLGLFYVRRL